MQIMQQMCSRWNEPYVIHSSFKGNERKSYSLLCLFNALYLLAFLCLCVFFCRCCGCAFLWHHSGSLHLQQPLRRVYKTHQTGTIAVTLYFGDSDTFVVKKRCQMDQRSPAVTLIGVSWGLPSWRGCLVSHWGFGLKERVQINTSVTHSVTHFRSEL